ncbi:hypothetical protein OG21DRAFT_1525019 [Imleria badia]|nr:hypothetical protein OG21DRAFT_1525019 [Imleria badia]
MQIQLAFHTYLRSKNVIEQSPKAALPPLASINAVQAFNRDGASPPTLDNIAMDWCYSPLKSSRWNSEVIMLLSVDFHRNLKDETYPDVAFDEDTMNLPAIRKLYEQKLICMQQAYRNQMKINAAAAADERVQVIEGFAMKEEKQRKAERMTSRRHGTLAWHKKIVSRNHFRDPMVWDATGKIITRLDVEGMSGDETDSPHGFNPKVLRCLEFPWINPTISHLFKALESYEPALRLENMMEQIGNSPLERCWEAARKDIKSRVVAGLPRNWYDDSWFQGLSAGAHSVLTSRRDVGIPTLEYFYDM